MTELEKKEQIKIALDKLYPQLQINVKKVCGAGSDLWLDNLLPHTLEQFMSMDTDKQYKILYEDKMGENYISRAMALQLKSSTSSFYRIYRRGSIESRELLPEYHYQGYNTEEDTDVANEVKECLLYHTENSLDFYDKFLIKEHYFKGIAIGEMAIRTDIQPGRLTRDIKKALTKLKKLCSTD